MKKILALVLCLSLCACGGGNDAPETTETPTTTTSATTETTAPAETEPQYETIEITIDNWMEYFEIREDFAVEYNDFNEVIDGLNFYNYIFCLKEEYINRISSADIAVECTATGKAAYWFEHNNETKEISIGAQLTEQEMNDRSMAYPNPNEVFTDTSTFTDSDTEISLIYAGQWLGLETSDNITKWVNGVYQSIEITRIQGTITIAK